MYKKTGFSEIIFPKEYYIDGVNVFDESNRTLLKHDDIAIEDINLSFSKIKSAPLYLINGKSRKFRLYIVAIRDFIIVSFYSNGEFYRLCNQSNHRKEDLNKNCDLLFEFTQNKIKENEISPQFIYSDDYSVRAVINDDQGIISLEYEILVIEDEICFYFQEDINSNNYWTWESIEGISYCESIERAREIALDYLDTIKHKEEEFTNENPILWRYSKSYKESLITHLVYANVYFPFLMIIGLILALTKVTNWYIMLLFLAVSLITFLITFIVIKNINQCHIYTIYENQIEGSFGMYTLNIDQIKEVKLVKNIFNRKRATIKFKLKKGFAFNYHFRNVGNYEEAYKILKDKIDNDK